ncbi:MAG: hypothetical protein IPH08_00085 [Rhodocyclaceae bacterium]|nr:hypothetical protein [Rhodocyclaceae bacterium]
MKLMLSVEPAGWVEALAVQTLQDRKLVDPRLMRRTANADFRKAQVQRAARTGGIDRLLD